MFDRALIATDLSDASLVLAQHAGCLKNLGVRKVHLVHCVNIRVVGTLAETLEKVLAPVLEQHRKASEDQQVEATAELALGLPHIEINRIATEQDYPLIVVGTQGHSLIGERLLGGTASSIIHSAERAVLLFRIRARHKEVTPFCEAAPCNLTEHILHPTDFSDNAELAFEVLQEMAASVAIERISLLHVQDKAKLGKYLEDRLEEFNRIDTERLERLKRELAEHGAGNVATEIPYGSPVSEIVKYAREQCVSLIIMGSQGRGFIGELFLGSVSHNVARLSNTHVLLVPARRE